MYSYIWYSVLVKYYWFLTVTFDNTGHYLCRCISILIFMNAHCFCNSYHFFEFSLFILCTTYISLLCMTGKAKQYFAITIWSWNYILRLNIRTLFDTFKANLPNHFTQGKNVFHVHRLSTIITSFLCCCPSTLYNIN